MQITGVVEGGKGQGAFFVGLDWVIEQFEREMGFKPFPGTLNVRVSPGDVSELERLFSDRDFELIPDDPQFCSARVKRLSVNGLPAAAVLPSEDVRIHGKDVIEIMAGCHIKQALQLDDGDRVTLIVSASK
jgi:CTP-dependent riboflavin kinase